MFTAYTVVASLLSAILFLSAYTKMIRFERTTATLTKVGVAESQFAALAACEMAGGLGLLAGLSVAPLGIAAAIGVSLYFAGAVAAHVRIGDWNVDGVAPPAIILAMAVTALALRIQSA